MSYPEKNDCKNVDQDVVFTVTSITLRRTELNCSYALFGPKIIPGPVIFSAN
jgi:hypothetical protein